LFPRGVPNSIWSAVVRPVMAGAALLFAHGAHGQDIAEKAAACAGCHGESGNSRLENTPSLAGHPAPYLTIQLILFREEQRRHEVMTPIAKTLADEDIEQLAKFYAGLKREKAEGAVDTELAKRGEQIAAVHRCGTCHLPDYSGREQIPRLAGQRRDYLLKTMRDYKAGVRSGLDGMMTEVLHEVREEQLQTLAAYLSAREP
jgi:cytochrome c553